MKKLTTLLLLVILASCAPTSSDMTKVKKGKGNTFTTLCPVGDKTSSSSIGNTKMTYYKLPSSCKSKIVKTCTSRNLYPSRTPSIKRFTYHKGRYAQVSFTCLTAESYQNERKLYKMLEDAQKKK